MDTGIIIYFVSLGVLDVFFLGGALISYHADFNKVIKKFAIPFIVTTLWIAVSGIFMSYHFAQCFSYY